MSFREKIAAGATAASILLAGAGCQETPVSEIEAIKTLNTGSPNAVARDDITIRWPKALVSSDPENPIDLTDKFAVAEAMGVYLTGEDDNQLLYTIRAGTLSSGYFRPIKEIPITAQNVQLGADILNGLKKDFMLEPEAPAAEKAPPSEGRGR